MEGSFKVRIERRFAFVNLSTGARPKRGGRCEAKGPKGGWPKYEEMLLISSVLFYI
jgi:hypothetical protein